MLRNYCLSLPPLFVFGMDGTLCVKLYNYSHLVSCLGEKSFSKEVVIGFKLLEVDYLQMRQ